MIDKNPYVGLRPYEPNESLLFFGRETQTWELLQRLYTHRFVAVVGSSGCGKSSLLRAGLIPALKGGFLIEDSDEWVVAIMKPGESPLYNLADSLLKELRSVLGKKKLIEKFKLPSTKELLAGIDETGVDAILDLVAPIRKTQNINFFVLVDQFEELFAFAKRKPEDSERTLTDNRNEAITLVNLILELSEQSVVPFYLVLTMRSDFIGDCAEYYGLPEAMNKSQYLVPRLTRQQLKKVIEGPAILSGKKINSKLTSKLINSMGDSQDELPILQHALMRMWEFDHQQDAVEKNIIDFTDYTEIGGLENALQNHAEEVIEPLSESEKITARSVFRALTTIDSHNRIKRRPVRLSRLVEITNTKEKKLLEVIEHFKKSGRSFIYFENIGDEEDKLVDISHESLIRQWKNLKKLVKKEKQYADKYNRLSQTQVWYDADGRLLEGSQFEKEIQWYDELKPTQAWAEQYNSNFDKVEDFIERSRQSKIRHDKAQKNKKKSIRIGFGVVALTAVAGLFFWALSIGANQERAKIEEERKEVMDVAKKMSPLASILVDSTDTELLEAKSDTINVKQDLIELVTYLESQAVLYENEKRPDAAGHVLFITGKDSLFTQAKELRREALRRIDVIEIEMDSISWKETLAMAENSEPDVKFKAYSEYIDKIQGYENNDNAKHYDEAQKRIDGLNALLGDNNWIEASTKSTVSSYFNYININQDESSNSGISQNVSNALDQIKKGKTGWIYAGYKDGNGQFDRGRSIVKVVYHQDEIIETNNYKIPKEEDFITLRGKADRAVYNFFVGNQVTNKKGAPFKSGEVAYVNQVVELANDAVFLQIKYGKIDKTD